MQDNQVKILGGFLSQGELNYKEGVFKGYVVWPPELKKIRISFSEHYIERIELHEYITNGARGKDACFSMMLTDGRELKLRTTESTYQKIYGKSRFSKKFPTVIINEPHDILGYIKWGGVAAVVLGGFYFCSADPTPEQNYSLSVAQPSSPITTQPVIYSPQKLCKAGVSSMFFDKIKAIKVDKISGDINYLHAKRVSDGVVWRYACKVVNNTIVLAGIDVFHQGTNEQSRWMDDYEAGDTKLTHSVDIETKRLTVHLAYSDGSSDLKTFEFGDFSRRR